MVINYKKNGMKGYIGGNTLMEMAIAFYLHRPIFIFNHIDATLPFKEEVLGMEVIFLDGKINNLTKVNKFA